MTTTVYKGKHKKPEAYGGSTPRGPQRWARAADNALRNPTSNAAKLFYDRVVVARAIVDAAPHLLKQPFAHMQPDYDYPTRGQNTKSKRKYTTCGAHCAAMQVMLDYNTLDAERVALIVGGGSPAYTHHYTIKHSDGTERPNSYVMYEHGYAVNKLDTKTLKRPVKCAVCGTKVGK